MLPDGLEQRFRELRRRPKERAALRADREAAVERVVFGTARDVWLPEIPLPPDRNRPAPRTVEEPGRDDLLAGLDAEGRPAGARPPRLRARG